MATAAIVLAAGRGARFAGPGTVYKLVSLLDGEPLIRHAVRTALAAPVDEVVVVTGDPTFRVMDVVSDLDVLVVENPDFREGMASSLRRGVAAVRGRADATLIALGDQPAVPVRAYRDVLDAWRRDAPAIVVPTYQGSRGHPVLFSSALFEELGALTGDSGARSLIDADPARVRFIELPDAPPLDVDTVDDLERLRGKAATL